jgi:hypothetical protein
MRTVKLPRGSQPTSSLEGLPIMRLGVLGPLAALGLLAAAWPALADPDPKSSTKESRPPSQARAAAERGLGFLVKDAAKWRADKQCSTCHHGTMTVWALSEAKAQGYPVAADTQADVVKWNAWGGGEARSCRPEWGRDGAVGFVLTGPRRSVIITGLTLIEVQP